MSDATNPCRDGHVSFGVKILNAYYCNACRVILDTTTCNHGFAVASCPMDHDHIRALLDRNGE